MLLYGADASYVLLMLLPNISSDVAAVRSNCCSYTSLTLGVVEILFRISSLTFKEMMPNVCCVILVEAKEREKRMFGMQCEVFYSTCWWNLHSSCWCKCYKSVYTKKREKKERKKEETNKSGRLCYKAAWLCLPGDTERYWQACFRSKTWMLMFARKEDCLLLWMPYSIWTQLEKNQINILLRFSLIWWNLALSVSHHYEMRLTRRHSDVKPAKTCIKLLAMLDPILFLFVSPACTFDDCRHVHPQLDFNRTESRRERRAQPLVVQCRHSIVLHPCQWLADCMILA